MRLIMSAVAAVLVASGGCHRDELPPAPTPTPIHTPVPSGMVGRWSAPDHLPSR